MGRERVQAAQPRMIRTPAGRWLAVVAFGQSHLGVFGTSEEDSRSACGRGWKCGLPFPRNEGVGGVHV
jgi:hypothetical protein